MPLAKRRRSPFSFGLLHGEKSRALLHVPLTLSRRTQSLAEAMGFHLITNPAYLEVLEAKRAQEVIDHVKKNA